MPRLITPGIAFKHLRRYRQVVGILTRYGFGEFLSQLRLWEVSNIERRLLHRDREFAHLTTSQRLRLALEELGPTFVKLGQMLSTRPDLIPSHFILELEKLQNRVAPMPVKVARSIIEHNLGTPISEIFSSFEDHPLAAASLAQVHLATYRGERVVVKVQRPHIPDLIEVDLEILQSLAALMERSLPGAYVINPVGLVHEFTENIHRELDFRLEAANMRRFAKNFGATPWVHVPKLFEGQYSTRKVLVMEYIDGIHISEIERLKKEGYDLKLIAERGAEIALKSSLEFGFFHADPHPGNLVILPGNVICLLDYGLMGNISERFRQRLARIIYYIAANDEKRTARAVAGLMESAQVIDAEALETDVSSIITEYAHLSLADIQLGNIMLKLLRLMHRHRARFPLQLIWLSKAITTVEDIAHKLQPDFDMVEFARPFAQHLIVKTLNPIRQGREIGLAVLEALEFVKDLPYDAGVVLDQLKKGRVKIEFEHIGLEPLMKTLHMITNRISITIIMASLMVSSALIILAGIPPKVGEVPLIGLIGFSISSLMAVWLIIRNVWRGR